MADTDILTLDEAQTVIGAQGNQDYDDRLARLNSALVQALEPHIGCVVIRTVTDETHRGCTWAIALKHTPVSSITTVTELNGTNASTVTEETWGTNPAIGYLYENGLLLRRAAGYDCYWGDRVKVTYEAGRFADTDSVDPAYKEAAAIVLEHNWRVRYGSGNQTFGAPDGIDGITGRGFFIPNAALQAVGAERSLPGIA